MSITARTVQIAFAVLCFIFERMSEKALLIIKPVCFEERTLDQQG